MNIIKNKKFLNNIKLICKKYELYIFILFGSRAKGTYTQKSDYDFAFIPKSNFSSNDEISLFNDIIDLLENENVDLINIANNYSAKLRYEIFFAGIPLFESKKNLFSDLKGRAYIDYIDYKRFSNDNLVRIKNRIENI